MSKSRNRGTQLHVWLKPDLNERLIQEAKRQRRTMSELVRFLLEEKLPASK